MENRVMTEVLPDIPRIYTALAEWLACVMTLLVLKPRLTGWKRWSVCMGVLAVQVAFLELTGGLKGIGWLLCMLAASLLMCIFLFVCVDAPWKNAVYYASMAFMYAELAASLEWQLYCYSSFFLGVSSRFLGVRMLAAIYTAEFVFFFYMNKQMLADSGDMVISSRELWTMLVLVLAFFALSNAGFTNMPLPFGGQYSAEIFNVRTLVDLGGVAIVYAFHLQGKDAKLRREYEAIQDILQNQYQQYEQSKRTLELINYKYHDLKHHIIALRAEEDGGKRNEYLDRMEDEIRTYEAQNKTGNKVLDTLLTTKQIYCQKSHISLTSVVDGTLFGFMDVMDICSIFGNALDNAIESVRQLADEEKRIIHVSAFSKKSFLIIRFENYFEGAIEFQQDLPRTTKKAADFHGYGLKSLQYTVHKYKGEVDISTENNWFCLKILIPL